MCGIAGILRLDGGAVDGRDLVVMADTLAHRGPDGEGYALLGGTTDGSRFVGRDQVNAVATGAPCGFAHRRLAVIDLSAAGIQPMQSDSARTWINFNGEIFNYLELRRELEQHGRRFRSETDTEVLLQALEEWGLACLDRLNGMWAFALWDERRRRLLLARDRFGIKPLYFARGDGSFAFASEPKALLALSWVSRQPDERAIADFLVHSRTDSFAWTFFKDIERLPPGHSLEIGLDAKVRTSHKRWWQIADHVPPRSTSDREAQERFRELLHSAVQLRLRSDVPLGACLSGGLDSAAVLCLARPELVPENRQTFSVAYDSAFPDDESEFIDVTVESTGVRSHRVAPTSVDLLQDLDRFAYQQDEPVTAASQYAEFKVFELAHKCGATVSLDGHGADELLAGYPYFLPTHLAGLVEKLRWLSAWRELRAFHRVADAGIFANALATGAAFSSHRAMIRAASRFDPSRRVDWVSPRLQRIARSLEVDTEWSPNDRLNRRLYEVLSASGLPAHLRFVDRNAMASSVEARSPFLDHRLVLFIFSLPPEQKLRNGWTKYVLREAMAGTIPEAVRTRGDKSGFAIPAADWFRGSLLSNLRSTFDSVETRRRGLYDQARLLDLLDRHAAGEFNAARPLWRAWTLELWCRQTLD